MLQNEGVSAVRLGRTVEPRVLFQNVTFLSSSAHGVVLCRRFVGDCGQVNTRVSCERGHDGNSGRHRFEVHNDALLRSTSDRSSLNRALDEPKMRRKQYFTFESPGTLLPTSTQSVRMHPEGRLQCTMLGSSIWEVNPGAKKNRTTAQKAAAGCVAQSSR